jgi:hypothetical protein
MSADPGARNPEGNDPLQFDVAERTASAGASDDPRAPTELVCTRCSAPIMSAYYQVNGDVACVRCRGALDSDESGSRGARVLKAGGLGLLAAIGGSVVYYAIAAITGYELALVAIAVGYGVGRAVRRGSGNRGGRAYQVLAVVLTYFAIVSTYIPLALKEFGAKPVTADSTWAATKSPTAKADTAPVVDSAFAPTQAGRAAKPRVERVGFGMVIVGIVGLLLFAAIIPILAGFSNIIGLIIIGVALFEAWKQNKRGELTISGPYRLATGTEGVAASG